MESDLDIFLTVLDLTWLPNGIDDISVLHLYLSSWGLCFYSNVSIDQCRQRGAVLVFTVMDHDYVFENDFAGEAYVDLCNIPGVDGQDISGFDALAITALPLMQPQHKGSTISWIFDIGWMWCRVVLSDKYNSGICLSDVFNFQFH